MSKADQYATELILAVQSCDPVVLRQTIKRIEEEAEWDWMELYTNPKRGGAAEVARKMNYINSTFGPMGLTALHVAAKGYAAHTQEYGRVFNEMIRMLVEAGADPCLAFGQQWKKTLIAGFEVLALVDKGRTIAEECKGNIAPALRDAYAALPADNYFYEPDAWECRRMQAFDGEQRAKVAA